MAKVEFQRWISKFWGCRVRFLLKEPFCAF